MIPLQEMTIDERSAWQLQYITVNMAEIGRIQWHLHLLKDGRRIYSTVCESEKEAKDAVRDGKTKFGDWDLRKLPELGPAFQFRWAPAK